MGEERDTAQRGRRGREDRSSTGRVLHLYRRLAALLDQGDMQTARAHAAKLPGGDLVSGPLFECHWGFVEPLADEVAPHDAALARRLYELALESWRKQASAATGAGEAYQVRAEQERLSAKLEACRTGPWQSYRRPGR